MNDTPSPAEAAPSPCPRCGRAAERVVRRVPCACDAPWCTEQVEVVRCVSCVDARWSAIERG